MEDTLEWLVTQQSDANPKEPWNVQNYKIHLKYDQAVLQGSCLLCCGGIFALTDSNKSFHVFFRAEDVCFVNVYKRDDYVTK